MNFVCLLLLRKIRGGGAFLLLGNHAFQGDWCIWIAAGLTQLCGGCVILWENRNLHLSLCDQLLILGGLLHLFL